MTTSALTACVLALAICLPATCKGQYYWGANGWRQYWQPSSSAVCDRAYPARQTGGYLHSCRYYCSGLPVRYSFEQDGTPCYTNRWVAGACYAGRCQVGWWPVEQPAALQAPATPSPAAPTERSSLESQGWSWPSDDANSQRCTRADPQPATVRTSCRYVCKGWPIRHEDEADGTACQLSWWRQGFCFRGHCQRNYPAPQLTSDEDKIIEGGNIPVRSLRCRNYKGRVMVDGVLRSCQFVCKQRKQSFVAYEENGTPCAALPGQNGFCDHGVCRAHETTTEQSEPIQTPTEHLTEERVAVVSSVTDTAPLTAGIPAAEDASAAEAQGAITAVTKEVATTDESDAAPLTAATIIAEGATATEAEDAIAEETKELVTTSVSAIEEEPDTAAPAVRSPWTPGFVGVQCDRAYPPKLVDGRARKCRFVCRGFPLRIGFEEDGTPCLKKKTLEGVCLNGNCKPLPPSTDATTLTDGKTTVQSYVTEADVVSTSRLEETTTDTRTTTEDAKVASTVATAVESEVSADTPKSESGASAAADVDGTSAATDSSRTGTEGNVADAASASGSKGSATVDVEESSATTNNGSLGTGEQVTDATSASESAASGTAGVEKISAGSDSSSTGTEGKVADGTLESGSGDSSTAYVEEISATTDSGRTETERKVADATSESGSGGSATADVEGSSATTDSDRTGAERKVADATSASETGASDTAATEETSAVADTSITGTEGQVSDATSASESGASGTDDIEQTSAVADSSRTGTEGYVSDATSASEGGAPSTDDIEQTSAVADSSRTGTEGHVSDATSTSESGASSTDDIEQTSAVADSSRTGTEVQVSDATSASESGASAAPDVEENSSNSESSRSDTKDEVSEATSSSKSEASETSHVQGTLASTDTGVQGNVSTDASQSQLTVGEESQRVGVSVTESTPERAETSTIDRSTETPNKVSTDEQGTGNEQPQGTTVPSEAVNTGTGFEHETVEASSESPFITTEAQAGSEEVSTRSATVQHDLDSTAKTSSSDEAQAVAAPNGSQDTTQVTPTASERGDSYSESSTQMGTGETKDKSGGSDGQDDQASSDHENQSTVVPSPSDVTSITDATTEVPSPNAALNTGGPVSEPAAASHHEGELTTSATGDSPSDESTTSNAAGKVILESTEKTGAVTMRENVTDTGSGATEGFANTENPSESAFSGLATTEGTIAADESATVRVITTITRKEILRPIEPDSTQPDGSLVQGTSSVSESLTTVESSKTAMIEVAAESALTTNEVAESQPAEGDSTTPSLSSAGTVAQQDVFQGTEASYPDQGAEVSTAADESATLKVITTITRKEILRPVEPDSAQPDASFVQGTSSIPDALTTVENANTDAIEVAAETAGTTNKGAESQLAEGDSTTPSLSSAGTAAHQDVFQGTEASYPDQGAEVVTVADESATVKVITTVTRKEIVRPINPDASQPDATLVQQTSSTSVETLPVSGQNETAQSSPAVPVDGSPSETGVVAGANVANTEAVSSGPSLIITDFVQKAAASSKDTTTTPSVQEDSTIIAESDVEVNATV